MDKLLDQIQIKALLCERAEEALALYKSSPNGTSAQKIYLKRWLKLAIPEYEARVASCLSSDEVLTMRKSLNSVPYSNEISEMIDSRFIELRTKEIQEKANACGTSVEIKTLWQEAELPVDSNIYKTRWHELITAECKEKLVECRTVSDLKSFTECRDSAPETFKERLKELLLFEAEEVAITCSTADDVRIIFYEDINAKVKHIYEQYKFVFDSKVADLIKGIYERRWLELHLLE